MLSSAEATDHMWRLSTYDVAGLNQDVLLAYGTHHILKTQYTGQEVQSTNS